MEQNNDGYAFALSMIWLGGYALASLIFSFAETQPAVAVAFIIMMISCMRFPFCVAEGCDVGGAALTKPLKVIYVLSTIGIIVAAIRVISFL